ncbi:MAG TPA: hypothetical protein VJ866_00865 [Pyrinomonadaceae bacterium]|nr:hypothetical protein [Pyrinomonadaceae bacterium]
MKRTLSLALCCVVCISGLASLAAGPARAQEIASVGNLGKLREQYERLLAVERDPSTPAEVRRMNRTFLEERRAQLAAALDERIHALRAYQAGVAGALGDDERLAVDAAIRRLVQEMGALRPSPATAAEPAPAARTSRRATRAPKAVPVVEVSSAEESAPQPAVPAADAPEADAAGPEPTPDAPRKVAPIEITSPDRDRVVHTAEVELEVRVNDEAVDDLMVAVYTPAGEKPVSARTLELKRSDKGTKSVVVALSQGDNRVEVSDLKRGEVKAVRNVTYQLPPAPPIGSAAAAFKAPVGAAAPAPQTTKTVEQQNAPSEYDWGRVRSYFTAGMIFSKEREDFSKSDLALSFVLDKNYIKSTRWNLNTFFEARLTSLPVAAKTPETDQTTGSGNGGNGEGEQTDQLDAFITSKKAGFAQVGVYLPVNVTSWRNQREWNTLFIAPLAKGGVMTITGDRKTAEAETFGSDDVFNFFSFGVRLGHFRYPRLRNPCSKTNPPKHPKFDKDDTDGDSDCDSFADYAPELLSWLDITTGRWENFDVDVPTGQLNNAGDPITTRQRRWRYQAEGRLKIPETPFLVGFDGNFGKGPDDLRFGFGMRFDIAKVIHKLKLSELGENPPAQTPANPNGGGNGGNGGSGGPNQ